MLTRIRSLSGAGGAVLALAGFIGGCAGATTTGSSVTGSTLSIYAGREPGDPAMQDVLDAERLALKQAGGQVGRFKVVFKVLDQPTLSDDARAAIQDSSTIAYLGELVPHSSSQSLSITNAQGILQVSPTDSALELTKSTPAVPGAPDKYYESLQQYHRTFGRVVPSSDHEASVQVGLMAQAKVHNVYVTDDGSFFGRAIAYAVAQDARARGIAVVGGGSQKPDAGKVRSSGADALFAGADVGGGPQIARLYSTVAAAAPRVRLYAPTPLDSKPFTSMLAPAAQRVLTLTQPGFLATALTPAGRKFLADFKAVYGRLPDLSAIFGYEAMAVVLDALRRAGTAASSRSDVVKSFLRTSGRSSVLGTYSIDSSTGDIQGVAPYVVSRIVRGQPVPYEQRQG